MFEQHAVSLRQTHQGGYPLFRGIGLDIERQPNILKSHRYLLRGGQRPPEVQATLGANEPIANLDTQGSRHCPQGDTLTCDE